MNLETAVTILPTPAALVARDTRRADEVSATIKRLDGLTSNNTFDQAELFAEVDREAHWATAGFESQEDYYKGLGIEKSKREIQYLTKMYKALVVLGLQREQYAPAKVSKLKVITQLDPASEVVDEDTKISEPMSAIMKRLIATAPNRKIADIQAEVDQLLGVVDEEDELTWLNLPIRRDAKEVVMQAIELARALSGDTVDVVSKELKDISEASALERIAADFLASPSNQLDELGHAGEYSDSIADGDSEVEEQDIEVI
jgi:hypothetical protein